MSKSRDSYCITVLGLPHTVPSSVNLGLTPRVATLMRRVILHRTTRSSHTLDKVADARLSAGRGLLREGGT